MEVGEVRVASDEDFQRLKELADKFDGWSREYKKGNMQVWTKSTPHSSFKMIKLCSTYEDIKPETVYDVIHDPDYRKVWDPHMIESYDIGCLNPNNDVGYYSVQCPTPLKNRDFVLQRSWLETGTEFLLLNHSVYHEDFPPKKGFIRATSYLTGFVIRPKGNGCELCYVSQSDPRGSLPPWLVNKVTQVFAPSMMKYMKKACIKYPKWKLSHGPNFKPWIYPEQMTAPRINLAQCTKRDIDQSADSLEQEEANLDENAFKDNFLVEEEDV